MGSHAGATAEGQRILLTEYGVTEEGIGAPIVSSMETVSLGRTPVGIEAFMDRAAWESGRVLLLNRVKTHTDFHGEVESGLMKIMAVGLGKLEGARSFHENSMSLGFEKAILAMGRHILGAGRILAGIGLVENDRSELCEIAAAPAREVEALDRRLLVPDPPIRGGLCRPTCGTVWARPVDMGGGSWGEVPECCKIFHPLGVKIAELFPLCANSPSLRPPPRPCCSSLIPSRCKKP
jgi:hypothetical protein